MKAIGLMSGTSLDGLDIAYCDIEGSYTETKVKLLDFAESPMPLELKNKILKACSIEESDVSLICSLNFELGTWMGDCVKQFMEERNLSPEDIDFIASHGQTIYHQPKSMDTLVKSTLQIGEPAVIAWKTGVQVISGFRTMDMAAGGEGAPLVPYADYILYRDAEKTRILLNIGGISNVTCLFKGTKEEEITAFDTGPGNMMIDEAMRILYQKEYDEDGKTASSGAVQEELLNRLMEIPYIHELPPKSTGREMFGKQMVMKLLQEYAWMKPEDMIATLTAFTAKSIACNVRMISDSHGTAEELIAAGGGAHNPCLLKMLKEYLPEVTVLTQEDLGYSSDAKEAIAFVILGNETLHHHYSNMVSATGASAKVILGSITPKPEKFR